VNPVGVWSIAQSGGSWSCFPACN